MRSRLPRWIPILILATVLSPLIFNAEAAAEPCPTGTTAVPDDQYSSLIEPTPPSIPTAMCQFPLPRIHGELVDVCIRFGRECGQEAADMFCRLLGFDRAIHWQALPDQRTIIVLDSLLCEGCTALVNVVCVD